MQVCRNCGAEAAQDVQFCQSCGAVMEVSVPAAELLPYKSKTTALMLAGILGILLMGFGHFYLNKFKRGFVMLISGVVTGVLFFTAFFGAFFGLSFPIAIAAGLGRAGLWMWQAYDANNLTNSYNEKLRETGRPPW